MVIGVDRQHGEAVNCLACRRLPPRPQTGYTNRLAISARNPCRYGLAAAPVGLVNSIGRDDAAMTFAPSVPEAGQGRCCLTSGIEGMPSELIVFGPMRKQTELASWRGNDRLWRIEDLINGV